MGNAILVAITPSNMTPAENEQLRFALSQPRYANWPAPPIVPGNWRDLSGDLALNSIIAIHEWLKDANALRNLAIDWCIDRVRVRPLSCYEDTVLVELGGHAGYGRPGLINVIVHDTGMALLNGASRTIHELNNDVLPLLNTPLQRLDYLQLFMNWVHAEFGRFQPVASDDQMRARLLPEAAKSYEPVPLAPFEELAPPEDTNALASYQGTVLYGGALFRSVMALYPGGLVEMIDDEQLLAELPVREERLTGPMIVSQI